MKSPRLFILFLLVLVFYCPIQAKESVKGPRIEFSNKTCKFNEVFEGTPIEHTFVFFNRGDQPLEIKKVKPG